MKDSGIEWIGEIPESWGSQRLRFLCSIETGNMDTQDHNPDGIYPFYVRSPIIEHSDSYTFDNEAVLMAGDGVGAGKVFHYVKGKYGCHQRVYSMSNLRIEGKFLYYYLSENFYKKIEASNAKSTVDSVRLPMLKDFYVVFPNEDEQKKIVIYLDRQCAHIDNIIEKTKASIEEYKKLRQAVITQAVTKGVRGDRPMKDSGIEWIGEIPAEWDVLKTIYLFKENVRTPDDNAISLSLSQTDGLIPTDEMKESSLKTSTYDGWKQVRLGDLVLNRFKGHLGVLYAAWIEGMVSFHYGVYEPQTDLSTKYYEYLYHSDCYKAILGLKSNGMTVGLQNLSNQNFYSVMSLYPPFEEQKEIVEYIDAKIAAINALITKKEQFLTELESYKKSMIYEYVTGKKEVPQA